MKIIPWTEILAFSNVHKYAVNVPDILKGSPSVTYRPKVKLHGENHAVQTHIDETVLAQSRSVLLSEAKDNKGFAKWAASNAEAFRKTASGTVIYGEWIGPGIQANVAACKIPTKVFTVFAARSLDPQEESLLIYDPEILACLVEGIPGTYVLPWYGEAVQIDWSATDEELSKITSVINDQVMAVEQNDPWVEATFGIKGTGEGLVYYPVSDVHNDYETFCNLVFKAKGSLHKMIKGTLPTQVNVAVAADINNFVDMVLTNARLDQGAIAVSSRDFSNKNTGKFITWICEDIKKECMDELVASSLEYKNIQKTLSDRARVWWLSKTKK